MPELSRFFGIIVRMYSEPNAVHHEPHIHAEYQGFSAVYSIDGEKIGGSIPIKQEKLIEAWIILHETELRINWDLLSKGEKSNKIPPLR